MPDNDTTAESKSVRLRQLRTVLDLSQNEMASRLGTYQSNYGKMESGKRPIGKNFDYKILNEFTIREEWWLYGAGQMMKENRSNAVEILNADIENELELIKRMDSTEFRRLDEDKILVIMPLVNQYAYAGYQAGWADAGYVEELPRHTITVAGFSPGIYRAFEVKGDSMDNGLKKSISEGDIVTGKKLDHKYWDSKFHINRYKHYVLVTKDGILIKQIIEHRVEQGIIVCHSLNTNKDLYPDFELSLDDVKEIFYIKHIGSSLI